MTLAYHGPACASTPDSTPSRAPFEHVPDALIALNQWVVWRLVTKKGKKKPDKLLYNPHTPTECAKTNDRATWSSFNHALAVYRANPEKWEGPGFVFSEDDTITGVDLDNCLDANGDPAPWARAILDRLDSYCEVSPSGKGVKVFVRGKLPGESGRRHKIDKSGAAVEMYDQTRFFTVTGRRLDGWSGAVEDRSAEVAAIYSEFFPPKKPKTAANVQPIKAEALPADDELLNLARKYNAGFDALFDRGDTSHNNGDASAADLALCNALAFWFGCNAAAMDRVFRRSALYRAKWDERRGTQGTYGDMTIAKAIDGCNKVYEPGPRIVKFGVPGQPTDGRGAVVDTEPRYFPQTDVGNGERIVARYGDRLRHVHPWAKWLCWDGKRWRIDDSAAVVRIAKQSARDIYREAANCDDDDERRRIAAWAKESESKARLGAALWCASSDKPIPVLPGHLDQHPWLLNVENGVIDLRTGELRPHDPGLLITRLCPVAYDPAAECPTWRKMLRHIFGGDDALIGYVRRLCGVFLTGSTTEQMLPIFCGGGSNGKSTLLGTLMNMLSTDYASKAPPALLLAKKSEDHPTEIAGLFGMRLVVAIETDDGRRLNESLVKELTGGDRIKARRMREDFWEFTPTHKLVLCTNHRPVIRGTDHAIWRRLKVVPFDVTIPDAEQDRALPEKLVAEYPGILSWCVRGCLEWQEAGLQAPEAVVSATESYRKDEDVLGSFLAEHSTADASLEVRASALYARYKQWAERSGERLLNQTKFGRALTERGVERFANNGIWYRGIGLRPE